MTLAEIKEIDRELHTYDVAQGGWRDGLGGAHHTLTHLVKDSFNKSFIDRELVQREIAPDSVMYGLRLARWGSISIEGLVEAQEKAKLMLGSLSVQTMQNIPLPKSRQAHQAAMHALAEMLHDYDHQSDGSHAPEVTKIAGVSGLLLHSAFMQAEGFGFDLEDAFLQRLDSLKERYSIHSIGAA